MANVIISPNMGLPVPVPGTDPGPDWALNLSACMSILDSHNHSTGQGQQIQPNGLNISSDLSFKHNNATLLRSTRFDPQSSPIPNAGTDVGCLYVSGNEIYYNDVTGGNQVQLTLNGSINAGPGSISGLPSGTASASFSSGTFVWQLATSTAANMDAGSYIFRNSAANSKGLTLQPPAAMASNFSLTLPSVPGSQSFMAIDASGNMSGYTPVANGIQRNNLVAVGQQISSSSGSYTTTSTSYVDVTSMTVTITTSGRPVMLMVQGDASGNSNTQFAVSGSGTGAQWILYRTDITNVFPLSLLSIVTALVSVPASGLNYLDTPTAGTYTYRVATKVVGANTSNARDLVLVAYEL